ncbi:MAG: OmpP1/FadL family transporter [Leptonema sp. (in: bacteria)]
MRINKFFLIYFISKNILFAGNYFDVYGAHPRSNGMANAVVSFINDVSSIFYNPAGLGMPSRLEGYYSFLEKNDNNVVKILEDYHKSKDSLPEGFQNTILYTLQSFTNPLKEYPKLRSSTPIHELTLGYNNAKPVNKIQFELYNPNSPDLKKIRDNYLYLGLSLNLNSIFDFNRIVRFGLYAGLPGSGNLALINDINPTSHRYLQNGVSNERPIIHMGIGVEIWKNHLSIGVGLQAMLKGKGAILMKDVNITPDPTIPNSQAILELKPLLMPQYGFMFHYGKFMVGINYRRETYAHVDPLGAQAQTTLLAIQFDFDMALLDLYSPRTLTTGFGFQLLHNLKLSLDYSTEYWSKFRHSRTKEYVFSPLKDQDELLRKNLRIPIFNFIDIKVIRIGFEWDWENPWNIPLSFRAGVGKKPSPVPSFWNEYNWMDNDRNIYTFGIGYAFIPEASNFITKRMRSPMLIDFSIENQQFKSRKITKINPTEKNPNYSYGGYAWAGSLSITLKF